ncbi:MAG TPA: endonuclease/exonuclease/phosphatase family protein [Gemmatimonadales bacterium]|nr:endonuclease/exonuclease/phosphatase family protein [Gemmatimonadales bacterium]
MATRAEFSLTPHEDDERLRLAGWRRDVGAPVALDLTSAESGVGQRPRSLVVLSWNVWIGRGRLREVISRIRDGEYLEHGADPAVPLVVLAQEAFRSDSSVPPVPPGRAGRVLVAQLGAQEDVVETAVTLGLNLRYAPSMRNGPSQSDRGNAILSSLPIAEATGVELPLVLQRRVAVSARIRLGDTDLRLVSAHLDPRGPPGHKWLGSAGRARQAQHLLASVGDDTAVLGADLNLGRGRYEPAWRLLGEAGFTFGVPPGAPPWRHTFHAGPRLVLDYLLVRDRAGIVARARVHRLDEHPRDKGPWVFGSDHHPLLARIDLKS